MRANFFILGVLFSGTVLGCSAPMPGNEGEGNATQRLACKTSADCGSGRECRVEDDGSFCHEAEHGDGGQAQEGVACKTDSDCAAGEECENEHGSSTCRTHGGAANADAAPAPNPGELGAACKSDDDCKDGLLCDSSGPGSATCRAPCADGGHEDDHDAESGSGDHDTLRCADRS